MQNDKLISCNKLQNIGSCVQSIHKTQLQVASNSLPIC